MADLDSDDETYEESQEDCEKHIMVCVELQEDKDVVDNAMEMGQKIKCPSCDLAGRKDDSCLHMTCTRCSTVW